jgi:alanine dehydrogenase
MRVIGHEESLKLLPLGECIELMADVLGALARGEHVQPLRTAVALPYEGSWLYTMPAYVSTPPAIAVKMVTLFPGNRAFGRATHQGLLALFDAATGEPLAIIDAAAVTAVRTAAVSGLATKLLARADAADLAILGSGVQARSHLEAMRLVRPLRRLRAWSPTATRLHAFVEHARAATGLHVEAAGSAEEAVRGADVICTVTASPSPVLLGDWLAPGAHVNAVGASTPNARELDTAAVARARLYVDRRESTLAEAGDFLIPRRAGAILDDHIVAELGELVNGTAPGRGSRDEVTVFKSLGLAVEDAAAAHHIHALAVHHGVGTVVDLGYTATVEAQ